MSEERKATGVRLDSRCGHVTITGDSGPALVTMVDTGQNLELWSHQGAHISPHVARMLADALTAWADKKTRAGGSMECISIFGHHAEHQDGWGVCPRCGEEETA